MKKIAFIALAAMLAAGGCCGNRKAATNTETETAAAVEAAPEKSQRVGGFTEQRALTDQDIEIFNTATKGMVGVRYTPESVATQVVAGTNYLFVCSGMTLSDNPEPRRAEIVVFKPLPGKGDPKVTSIKPL